MCNDGGIYKTDTIIIGLAENETNWATNWEYISDGMQITSFYRIGISQHNPDYLIGGAQDNSTYYYNAQSWTNQFGGDGMECIIHNDDPLKIWASSQYGNIVYSEDGGVNYYGIDYIAEQGGWTTPYEYNHELNKLYVAKGNLYESSNNGFNLSSKSDFPIITELGSPAPASAFSQSLKNPETFYVAKRLYHGFDEPSKIYVTQNDGDSWTDITGSLPNELYYTDVLADGNNPNLAWLTMGGYEEGNKILKTEDGGTNWENISYNLPNIPVNCIVQDSTTESNTLYIGTDLGVYYISGESEEWQLWGNNLPNVIVTELEINYTTEELFVATFGRGIWKIDTYKEQQVGTNNNLAQNMALSLYPTQNDGNFTIKLDAYKKSEITIQIVNIMGSTVYKGSQILNMGINRIPMNLNLDYGQYFLKVSDNKQSKVNSFIVK